jgi:hypothetical protein
MRAKHRANQTERFPLSHPAVLTGMRVLQHLPNWLAPPIANL